MRGVGEHGIHDKDNSRGVSSLNTRQTFHREISNMLRRSEHGDEK